jgi:anaerobic magnesium-protoporphyrin IX monomethyl ester cyclase
LLPKALIVGRPLRVVLVNPPPNEVVEPWYDTPAFARQGLACLAGYLRQAPGFEITVVDAKLERLSFDATVERVRRAAPDVVGLTAFTNEIKSAARTAGLLAHVVPDATLVIGGVHVTALPEATLREFPVFDLGCVGEGERTFAELCAALRDGGDVSRIDGLVLDVAGRGIIRTAERAKIHDLDELPLPAWDLFPRADEYWVMTQRGCPFTCNFCVNPNGRLPRQHGIERCMAEIEAVLRYRPKKLWFADEIFTVNRDHTEALLDAMIRARVGERVTWWAETHVRFVDEPLFRRMREAGCVECGLGIETGDSLALSRLGKGTSVRMVVEAFEAARRAGLDTIGFFIFGHPDETLQSMQATIDLAVRLNPTLPIFGVMVPYPGTEVARLAANGEAGYRLLSDDWDAYNKQVGGALEFAGISRRSIEALQLRAYIEVFLKNGRFRDLAKLVWVRRVAGARILAKLFRGSGEETARVPLGEARRREIAGAAIAWAEAQARSVRDLRSRSAATPRGRVGVRRLSLVQSEEAAHPVDRPPDTRLPLAAKDHDASSHFQSARA